MGVDVRLNALSPDLSDCALWNNPSITHQDQNLYLLVDCFAFDGTEVDTTASRTVVFRVSPDGPPSTWAWSYLGVIADHALAVELGGEMVVSPDVTRARDGTLVMSLANPALVQTTARMGCRMVELVSIDPATVRRGCDDRPVVRALDLSSSDTDGPHLGACTYDPASTTGMLGAWDDETSGTTFHLRATGVHP